MTPTGFLNEQRRVGNAPSTRSTKAAMLAQFYAFVIARYQGDIHALTGWVVEQPIDEFNKPASMLVGRVRVPPSDLEIDELFAKWRSTLPGGRYLPAARDYFAASLWRRLGLRINERVMLDVRDWRPDLGGAWQAPRPTPQGRPRSRPEGTVGARDQRRRRVDRLVVGRGAAPVRQRLVRPGHAE